MSWFQYDCDFVDVAAPKAVVRLAASKTQILWPQHSTARCCIALKRANQPAGIVAVTCVVVSEVKSFY
jgi:hypothetical protein